MCYSELVSMGIRNLEKEIKKGESLNLEFKRQLPSEDKKVLKTFVAFANGEGGKVLFGVEDTTGEIVGIQDTSCAQLQDSITDMISDSCYPQILPLFTWTNIAGKIVLVVEISPSPHCPYYLKSEGKEKGTYIRVGATTRKATPEKIRELEIYGARQTYDEIVEHAVEPVTKGDINQLCKDIRSYRADEGRPVEIEQLVSWRLLKQHHHQYLPSNAFRILTGRGIHFSRIQCAVFSGVDKVNFLDRKEFSGSAYELLEQAQLFLLQHLNKAARIESLRREDIHEIPVPALRELITNAILHRNYLVHGFIQVSVFDNRVEILSPGSLYANLTREEMLAGNSRQRNPILADIFQRMGIAEKWGTGIRRVQELCQAAGLCAPIFEVSDDAVRVTIFRNQRSVNNKKQVYSEREKAIAAYLAANPAATVRELASIFHIGKSTAARITKKLRE